MDATQGKGNMSKKTLNAKDMLTSTTKNRVQPSNTIQDPDEEYIKDSHTSANIISNKKALGEQNEILVLMKKIDHSVKRLDCQQRNLKAQIKIIRRNQQHILGQIKIILNQKTRSLPKQHLPKTTLPGSSVDECIHSEVLQENIRMLVRDMDLSNGLITDEILQIGCLTEDEVHEMKNLSKQDQIRKLTSVLGRNNKSKFFKFLEVISKQEFYPHVEKLLKESYEKKLKENEKHYDTKCIRCFLVQKVEIKRIMDFLCEHQFIGLPDIEDAIKGDRTNADNFWGHVFQKIFDPINGESYCSVFKEALQDHYPHIARKIHCQNHLKCCCRSDLSKSYPSGSIGDSSEISTTTTIIPNTKPETCLWVEKTCSLHDNLKEIQEEKSEYLHSQQDGNFTQTKVSMPFPSTEFGTSLESVRFNTGNLNATADHHRKSFIQGKRTSSKFKWNRSSSGRRHLNYSVKGRMNKSRYKWVNSNTSSENKPFDNRSENRKRSYNNAFVASEADPMNIIPSTTANFEDVNLGNIGDNQFRLPEYTPDKSQETVINDGSLIVSENKERYKSVKKPILPRSAFTYVRERTGSKTNRQLSNSNQQKKYSPSNHNGIPSIISNDIRVTVNREMGQNSSTGSPKKRRVNYKTDTNGTLDNRVVKKSTPRKELTLPFKRYEEKESHQGRRE